MFSLSKKSIDTMTGVHPDLVKVVTLAITLTQVDFRVAEGLRSIERQRELIKRGASQTMNSRHLTGHAVDLVALDGAEVSWQWADYHHIAAVMKAAAEDLSIPVEWGGVWDRPLQELSFDMEREVAEYIERRRALGHKRVFIDGPHFQLPFDRYPK